MEKALLILLLFLNVVITSAAAQITNLALVDSLRLHFPASEQPPLFTKILTQDDQIWVYERDSSQYFRYSWGNPAPQDTVRTGLNPMAYYPMVHGLHNESIYVLLPMNYMVITPASGGKSVVQPFDPLLPWDSDTLQLFPNMDQVIHSRLQFDEAGHCLLAVQLGMYEELLPLNFQSDLDFAKLAYDHEADKWRVASTLGAAPDWIGSDSLLFHTTGAWINRQSSTGHWHLHKDGSQAVHVLAADGSPIRAVRLNESVVQNRLLSMDMIHAILDQDTTGVKPIENHLYYLTENITDDFILDTLNQLYWRSYRVGVPETDTTLSNQGMPPGEGYCAFPSERIRSINHQARDKPYGVEVYDLDGNRLLSQVVPTRFQFLRFEPGAIWVYGRQDVESQSYWLYRYQLSR